RRIRQFHCRSYHAALIGVCAKKLLPIKIIFDPRSPFPEENLVPGVWGKVGLNYYFWKSAEKFICKKSDVVVAISEPFKESLKKIAPSIKVVVIPNNYPKIFMEDGKVPVRYEDSSNLGQMCYLGSLGNWNTPDPYVSFLKYLVEHSQIVKGAKFIVPPGNISLVRHALQGTGLEEKVSVLSVAQADVIERASDCIAGMQIMPRTDDRLSIKFVEYLASGMPVIVSENVRGAAYVAEKLGVGFVLKSDMSNIGEAVEFISKVSLDRAFWRKRCVDTANRYFSPRVVADELVKIYESI
ncbi:MAG: glycosyltransferase, partial [Thiohalomonadales bacterium]